MNLIVIAHPDDETLWFSSILLRSDCEVILVTCGNKKTKRKRANEFMNSMKLFGVTNYIILSYRDGFNNLDIVKLEQDLKNISKNEYTEIYTHGPYGDTSTHPHHQDVCYVVHKVFENQTIYSTSWNLYPDKINILEKEEYNFKKYVFGTIYMNEYEKLKDVYEISSIEKFIKLDFEEVDVYYWSCANFGDHHYYLSKYPDFWGFTASPYEIERHDLIIDFINRIPCKEVLEVGSCEGVLTKKLSSNYKVDCVEKNPKYQNILFDQGLTVIKNPIFSNYDLVILAQVLEYMENEEAFISKINSKYILIDIIPSIKRTNKIKNIILKNYQLTFNIMLPPRWEPMYINGIKKKLEIYRLGSNVMLFEKI